MKKRFFLIVFFLIFFIEIICLVFFSISIPDYSLDTVMVNEVVQVVKSDFSHIENHQQVNSLDYVVLDLEEHVLFQTKVGLSEGINEAIHHRDTILQLEEDGRTLGSLIIYNPAVELFDAHKKTMLLVVIAATVLQGLLGIGYVLYLRKAMIQPFHKLKHFAQRIAGGNLDIPLEMDKHNLFGAFTESFDMMRSELKKARLAEAEAERSKKELVAKLSHDIKTPVASIKAVSEVGMALADRKKDQQNYSQIICKADQINTLVSNLFTATLEELQQLTVKPVVMESEKIEVLLNNADYLHRAIMTKIPACMVYADELRLQQVLDNIFVNSYKYADTEIFVSFLQEEHFLSLILEDAGGGVLESELPFLKDKFKRGSNTNQKDGAGLGLYISDYFMQEMKGYLKLENGLKGLKVTIQIRLAGTI